MSHAPDPARRAATFTAIQSLLGTWRGQGQGQFPGIEAFAYDEETKFELRSPEDFAIHYEQRAFEHAADGGRRPSHWESGFLRVDEAGNLEVLNAQLNRVEVLTGTLTQDATTLRITLDSHLHGYDPRMLQSHRDVTIEGDTLRYEVRMATSRIQAPTNHLQATLHRTP